MEIKNTTITNKKSPFAVWPYEKLNVLNSSDSRAIRLTEVDQLVMLTVNEMLITTSFLLHSHLLQMGLERVSINDIRASLAKLSSADYLKKMEFSSPNGTSMNKVYSLSLKGQVFIKSKGKYPILSGYIDNLEATTAKRILSALQFILSQNYTANASSISVASVVVEKGNCSTKENTHIFRPNATIQFEDKTIFVDSVRRTFENEYKMLQKLKRIDDCLRNSKYLNTPIHDNVDVIIIAEDEDHMLSIIDTVRYSKYRFCYNLIFSNDIDTYNRPENCIYPYEPKRNICDIIMSIIQGKS